MNGTFGRGAWGRTHLDSGAVPSAAATATSSSSPIFGPAVAVEGTGSIVVSGQQTGVIGQAIIESTTIMAAPPSVKWTGQLVMPGVSTSESSGDIAWKGQQGTTVTWTIQRQHPNG